MAERTAAVVALAAACALDPGGAAAQPGPQQGPGLVMPAGDLDQDGCGDLLAFDGRQVQAWFGEVGPPWLRAGVVTPLSVDPRCARPVVSGARLYVAVDSGDEREILVRSWPLGRDGSLGAPHEHLLRTADPDAQLVQLRLAAFGIDVGGDGQGDVVAVFREEHERGRGRFVAAVIGPAGASRSQPLQLPGDQEEAMACVGLAATRCLARPRDEALMVFTEAAGSFGRGIGLVGIGLDANGAPEQRNRVWFPFAPALEMPRPGDEDASLVIAHAHPAPALAMPVLRLADGPSFTIHPDFLPPFLSPSGRWIETSPDGHALPGSAADYDGDGADEVVFVDRSPVPGFDLLAIAGPHPADPEFQALLWPIAPPALRRGPRYAFDVAHAAPVDFDGDGDPDLVLSLRTATAAAGSGFALFRAEPAGHAPRRSLVRVR